MRLWDGFKQTVGLAPGLAMAGKRNPWGKQAGADGSGGGDGGEPAIDVAAQRSIEVDGSWVLEHSFPRTLGPIYARLRPYAFLLFMALIFSGVLRQLLWPAFKACAMGLDIIAWCTPF